MLPAIAAGLIVVVDLITKTILILVAGSVIVSWLNADPGNPIVQMLERSTEPMYRPFRKFTRSLPGIDWAPMALLIVVLFLRTVLLTLLSNLTHP